MGFVHAIRAARIVTEITERNFIRPPFPETQRRFATPSSTPRGRPATKPELTTKLKSIGRAAPDLGDMHRLVSGNTLSDWRLPSLHLCLRLARGRGDL